jgi:hypothetical protein
MDGVHPCHLLLRRIPFALLQNYHSLKREIFGIYGFSVSTGAIWGRKDGRSLLDHLLNPVAALLQDVHLRSV